MPDKLPETLPITNDLSIIVNDELIIEVKGTQAILTWKQAKIFATVLRGICTGR